MMEMVVKKEIEKICKQDPDISAHQIQILETGKKYSECIVWRMIEEFYTNAGPAELDKIPYYMTSNPAIGELYASCIVSYLMDAVSVIDRTAPVYIIEMAAGRGVFSYYVLNELEKKVKHFKALKDLKLRYVMTELTGKSIDIWERHAKPYKLDYFLDTGMLDFAVFKPNEDRSLKLRRSNQTLAPGEGRNPLFALANYFFDSLKLDFLHITDGRFKEARVTFYRKLPAADEKPGFEELQKIDSFVDVDGGYYADERLNRILYEYGKILDKASVSFPLGAFDCIRNLEAVSNGHLVLIVTDKGFYDLEFMRGHYASPFYAMHSCTSYMVNFDALERYFKNSGGQSIISTEHHGLNTAVYILNNNRGLNLDHTLFFANEALVKKSLSNNMFHIFALLKELTDKKYEDSESCFGWCVAAIQLSNYDPAVFYHCCVLLYDHFQDLSDHQKRVFKIILARVRAHLHPRSYYAQEASNWLLYCYYRLDMFEACLEYCNEILAQSPMHKYATDMAASSYARMKEKSI